jgi:hypothetical protein
MVRRRPLLSAAAMSHATLAWPQARPHGPCDAQPRAYHGPSDFHLWAPVGRTAHAGNARLPGLPGRPCCCCRRRPAFRPLDESLRGLPKRETGSGLKRTNKPSYSSISFISTKDFDTPDTLSSLRPLAAPLAQRMRPRVSPPSPPDRVRLRMPLSDHMCSSETAYVNQKYTHTFRQTEYAARHRPLAPLVHDSPRMGTHASIPPLSDHVCSPKTECNSLSASCGRTSTPSRLTRTRASAAPPSRPPTGDCERISPRPPARGRGSPAPRKGPGTQRPTRANQPTPSRPLLARKGSMWGGCRLGSGVCGTVGMSVVRRVACLPVPA